MASVRNTRLIGRLLGPVLRVILAAIPPSGAFGDLRGTPPAYIRSMYGTFLQRVVLTIIIALCASGLVEFYKNFVQRADNEINRDWHNTPAPAAAHP